MWFCPCFGDERLVFALFDDARHIAVRVVKVAKIHALGWANSYTGGLLPFSGAVYAERAFVDMPIGVRVASIVRATGNTGATANTFFWGYQNHAAIFVVAGTCWAAAHTGRVFAVVAPFGADLDFKLRISSVGNFNDPVAAISNGYIVFGLAGHYAVAAPDTFFGVDRHGISHDFTSLSFSNLNVTKLPLMPVPPIIGSTSTRVIRSASLAPFP